MSVFNVFFYSFQPVSNLHSSVQNFIQCRTSIKNDKNVLHLFFIRHPTGSPDIVVVSDCIVDDIRLKRSDSQTRSTVPVANE